MRGLRFCLPLAAALALVPACERPTAVEDAPTPGAATLSIVSFAGWSTPTSVDLDGLRNINTAALEGCPIESPDGRSLYFASNRDGQIDIWVSQRAPGSGEWSEPEKLSTPVNSASNDFCPTPVEGGGLLFVSTRPGGCGGADIYQARLHPTRGWIDFEHLGCDVNSSGNEFSPSLVAAGGGMLFFSSNRTGQDGIYVSHRGADGTWGAPVPVAELNVSGFNTLRPNVSQDGRVIVFDSNRPGGLGGTDIWFAVRSSVNHSWSMPEPLVAVNSASNESRPSLSRDGRRLYVGSNRPGGEGDSDLFVALRR